jgi:hypothetical protein
MEKKYYTPDISEFYVGFEYELFEDNSWCRRIIEEPTRILMLYDYYNLQTEVRVKYLDKEDIESLGFRLVKDYSDQLEYQTQIREFDSGEYWFELTQDKEEKFITISYWEETELGSIEQIVFQGLIKNKSELKKLLKSLNKDYNEE